jgi:hypothetical protein
MDLFWWALIFTIVVVAGSFWFSHVAQEQLLGSEAALRNLRHSIPLLIVGIFVGILMVFMFPLLGTYGWLNYTLAASINVMAVIFGFYRKKKAGSLIANIGRTSQHKFMFRTGLFAIMVAVVVTWSFFAKVSTGIPKDINLALNMSEVTYWWTSASLFIVLGSGKLIFGENGVYFMAFFTKWQSINSYVWEPEKPNVLTIRFNPRFPILPGFVSIPIPAKRKDLVDSILEERLPGKNL